MTTPASGTISLYNVNSEIGNGTNGISLSWVKSNTKDGVADLNSIHNRAWYQSNNQGNCNNGNCGNCANCANGNCNCGNCNCSACGSGAFPNCNCTTLSAQCNVCTTNTYNCNNCNAINCANCDSRAWLQPNCNCACTYNCTQNAQAFNCNTTGNISYNCNCNCNCDCNCCCFTAGARVLMADGGWKAIETVRPGDFVMGPTGPVEVTHIMRSVIGVSAAGRPRRLMTFADDPTTRWSEEHSFWARQRGRQWWWTAGKEVWQAEVRAGVVSGLLNNDSHFEGAVEFAHLDGFVDRTVVEVADAPADTVVYLPCTDGSPIIVNGYLVGASLNQWGYDYTRIDWDVARHSVHFETGCKE